MTNLCRLAVLLLGFSAMPFVAHAADDAASDDTGTAWVYGVAADDDLSLGAQAKPPKAAKPPKEPKPPKPAKPPKTPPAPPPPPPPPAPPPPPPAPTNMTGAGILVAIVDTGIDLDHPEFAGRIAVGGACFNGVLACPGLAALGDDNHGHGTHVAGIVASAANGVGNTGVAPGASLLAVKVLDASGSGSYGAIATGITYAATRGARVINMSLGGSSPSTTLIAPLQLAASTAVIVAAAGNSGNALAPGYPAAYATQPGVVGSMIIVGSVGPTNVISSFSQTPGNGGCVASGGKTTCFKDVFLVAPGQSIMSAYMGGGYASMSGTSMATPYVSGVAARVLGAAPYLTPQQVTGILFTSATDLGAKGTDPVYGRGLVNLAAALAPLGTTSVATSGGSTSGFSGTGSVGGAGTSGVLATSLRQSQIAKELVFFDSFGRDYRTDLTAAASNEAMSVYGLVSQGSGYWRSVQVAGDNFSVAGFVADEAPNAVATAGFADRTHTEIADMVVHAKFSDDAMLTVGMNASTAGHLNALDLAASEAYDGLFMSASALNSPFLSLTPDARFMSAGISAGDGLTFSLGHAETEEAGARMFADEMLTADEASTYLSQDPGHLRSAENTVASVSWRVAPWAMVGFNVASTQEENSLLGSREQGALALTADAATVSAGFGARMNLGDDWVASVSWTRGQTEASPVAGGLIQSFSEIESEAYGFAISKLGVFGESDSIGFAVSRPLHITAGSAVVTGSTGVTEDREILYSSETLNLASSTPETDYEVGYTAALDDNLFLQANAMYQQNVGGEAGRDGVAAFVTLSGRF